MKCHAIGCCESHLPHYLLLNLLPEGICHVDD